MKTIAEFIWYLASAAAGSAVLLLVALSIYSTLLAAFGKDDYTQR